MLWNTFDFLPALKHEAFSLYFCKHGCHAPPCAGYFTGPSKTTTEHTCTVPVALFIPGHAVPTVTASSTVEDPVLDAQNLQVTRGGETVLDGISLQVGADERVLIQGQSGTGKTTLFEALGLLTEPAAGTLEINGHNAAEMNERERARVRRDHIGIVFQDFQLIPDLTVRENIALPQEHAGDHDSAWIDSLLSAVSLTDQASQYPSSLSGGEKQRTAAARALANRPDVVLADEPTGQLDPDTAEQLLDLFIDLQDETGASLVVVSHDRTLESPFERTLQLADGTLSPTT